MDYTHFMNQALAQAEKALAAGEFPVGCVMVYQNQILATGSRIGTLKDAVNEIDHAEMLALRRLVDLNPKTDRSRISLFSTLEPCLMCYGALLLSGIGQIVYALEDVMGGGTRCDSAHLAPLYQTAQLSIVPDILRQESLELFKTYFSNPENVYWKGSLLAKYIRKQ